MIQYKKILMTLALLLTAVTGAWADETPLVTITIDSNGNPVYSAEGLVTLTGTNYTFDEINGKYFWFPTTPSVTMSATVAAAADNVSITKVVFWSTDMDNNGNYNNSLEDTAAPYVCYANASVSKGGKSLSDDFATKVDDINISKIEVYGTAETIDVNPVAEPAANTKQWTFNQPGGDVVLTPIYAKAAAFATESTGSVVKTLLPAAAEGVIAGTTAPLIAEGTGIVATTTIGEAPTAQGTVMYAVTAATATEAPALTSSDWKNTVPTAKDIADDGAEVKVWYYIQGADAPQGEAATLDNTFNNSDVCATPLTVTVLSNKFDLALNPANANTIDATQASKGSVSVKVGDADAEDKTEDIADGKLKAIKMGSEVKLNTKAGYKFRKVEVKKGIPGPLTYATKEGAVTRIKFNYSGNVYYADFTYSNGSFTRTGGSPGYNFSGSWTMKEENGVLTMTANYNESGSQYIDFVCTFYAATNEYTAKSTGSWYYSFSGIEVNGTDITSQLTKVK